MQYFQFLRLHFLPLCAAFEPVLGVKAKEDFASALVRVLQRERRAAEALADLAMVEVDGQENGAGGAIREGGGGSEMLGFGCGQIPIIDLCFKITFSSVATLWPQKRSKRI